MACVDSGTAVNLCLSLPVCFFFFKLVWPVAFLLTGMANCSSEWCGFHLSGGYLSEVGGGGARQGR